MFINEKILIRLMRKAWKGKGVYIGRFDGWYVIGGSYWTARIAAGCASKKLLGAVVELSGAIPQEYEAWSADTEKNQLEGYERLRDDGLPDPEDTEAMTIRRVALITPGGSALSVLQSAETKQVLTIPIDLVNAALGIVDAQNGEEERIGPFFDGNAGAYWKTNHALWNVRETRYDELAGIVRHLEQIQLELTEKY